MTATAAPESNVRALLEAVERAEAAGRTEEAGRALAGALEVAPGDPLVLAAAGLRALRRRDGEGARAFFERALVRDGKNPTAWLNLALAQRARGDQEAERAALEQALALDPRFFLALLQKARLLERQGKAKQAAQMYHAFLCCVPSNAKLPAALQEAISHANVVVQANAAQLEVFLRDRIAETRARHAGERLERFDDCLDVLVGRKRVFAPEPTFMHFPYLPAIQFYEREAFDWIGRLEAATADIRAELEAVLAEERGFVPYISKPEGAPLDQWVELNNSIRWGSYFLLQNGRRIEDHLTRCPRTAAVLETLPLAQVPNHAPTAFFSRLAPKTRIPPHTGVTNTRAIVHLPLIVPPGCGFRVGSAVREWEVGKALIFDDTIEHEAWNDSEQTRVVLIFDIWNPHLTAVERELVSEVTEAARQFNDGESPFLRAL